MTRANLDNCRICTTSRCLDDHSDDEDPIEVEACGATLTVIGKRRKVVCNMVKGEGHGVAHKRIGRTGKVLHSWPMSHTEVLYEDGWRTTHPRKHG